MTSRRPARTTARRARPRWLRVAGPIAIAAAAAAALGSQLPGASAPTASRPPAVTPRAHVPPRGEAGGAIPQRTTVFDEGSPSVANLDRALLGALRRAAADAFGDGIEFVVDSGWRSPAHQRRLLREAIEKYGSEAEAARWVATPRTSAHVTGDAVDIGPAAAAAWLSEHGARYGLCQIYGNEPWHYELRHEAAEQGCPSMYADPTHDPRMRQ